MGVRRLAVLALCGLAVVGCKSKRTPVRWELSVTSTTGDPFGARIYLDRGQVYSQPSPTAAAHATTVEGKYALAEHVVEVEILAPTRPVGTYVATVKYTLSSDGRAGILHGVPTELRAGERLTLIVPLEAESSL